MIWEHIVWSMASIPLIIVRRFEIIFRKTNILEVKRYGRIRANLFGVRSRQGGASRKCPVDIFSERAGLKYGKVKNASARLFNTDMTSKTSQKIPYLFVSGINIIPNESVLGFDAEDFGMKALIKQIGQAQAREVFLATNSGLICKRAFR